MLVDDVNAQSPRNVGIGDHGRPPANLDYSGVGLDNTGEYVYHRALAGTVLAQQDVDLARVNVQVALANGQDTAEPLDQTRHADKGTIRACL